MDNNEHIIESEDLLDSRLVAYNAYMTDDDLPRLLVLVEDSDDKPFWQQMFLCVSDKYAGIDVWPLYEAAEQNSLQHDASDKDLESTGKDALMKVVGLGRNKMIAVDADYDMLIDDLHIYTNRVREDKYVQHTTYHSIENHLLDHNRFLSLPEVQTLLHCVEDYVYYVLCEKERFVAEKNCENKTPYKLTVDALRGYIGAFQYHPSTSSADIPALFTSLRNRVTPSDDVFFDSIKTKCVQLQVSGANVWQILQGHTLFEFVQKVVTYNMTSLRQAMEHEITINPNIPGPQKPKHIQEIKHQLLGACKDESEKFCKDVYTCTYLNMESESIHKIQQKILNDSSSEQD